METTTVAICEGCKALEARIEAIENEMAEARRQATEAMANMPKPVRAMLERITGGK